MQRIKNKKKDILRYQKVKHMYIYICISIQISVVLKTLLINKFCT